jgi:hypothetical protein
MRDDSVTWCIMFLFMATPWELWDALVQGLGSEVTRSKTLF